VVQFAVRKEKQQLQMQQVEVRVVRITIFDESRYELTSYTLTSGVQNAFQLGGFTECKAVNMG
jgi:hypothetical protein